MSASSSTLGSILLPKERGSWSLVLEPIALGLLAAPSLAGASLAVAGTAGFLARRPLKLAVTLDAADPRRKLAAGCTVVLALLAVAALAGAVVRGPWTALWPLLLATPFGAAFLWYDLRQEMREAEAELAGSIAYAVLPAAFGTLAGWTPAAALALAALSLGRSVPTVLTVRAFLRIRKGQNASAMPAIAAAAVVAGGFSCLMAQGLVPRAAPILAAVLLCRSLFFLMSPTRPVWSAQKVGIIEAVIGAVYVATLAAALHFA